MKDLLKNRNFMFNCAGIFVSSIGDHMYNIALTIAMYTLSGSVATVAGMWLVRAVIRIPGQFFAGILADKFNRKKVCVTVNIISALLAFMFLFVNENSIILGYVLISLLQATSDVDDTAGTAMLPEIVEKDKLASANSIFSTILTAMLFISPGLAGLIYTRCGVSVLYIINSVSFVFAALMFSRIRYQSTETKNEEGYKFTLFKFAKEGYKRVITNKTVYIVILVMMSFSILGRFYEIYKVYVADKILNIGSEGIIYFSYAMAFGSILTPFLIKFAKSGKLTLITSFLIVSLLSGIGYILWSFAPNLVTSCIAVFILGVFTTSMSVLISSIIQEQIGKEYVGRVFSFYKISIMCSAIIGIIISPMLLDTIGIKQSISIFAAVAIGLVVLFSWIQFKSGKKTCCTE